MKASEVSDKNRLKDSEFAVSASTPVISWKTHTAYIIKKQ